MSRQIYSNAYQVRVSRILPELLAHRGLLVDMVVKELRARYRNAMMGFVWAILQPLMMTLILTVVFSVVLAQRTGTTADGTTFAVYTLCGLVAWQFLTSSVSQATQCLMDNANLVKKVYFPREILPLAAVANCLVNFVIGFVLMLLVAVVTGGSLGIHLLWAPLIFAIELCLVVGLALLLSSLNVFYRDTMYFVDVAFTFGFYATPIFYRLDDLQRYAGNHEILYTVYLLLNPMASLITAYRTAVLENACPSLSTIAWPALTSILVLVLGCKVFRKRAPILADHL